MTHEDELARNGTPTRCYRCGTDKDVAENHGEGGFVYSCPNCPHPTDA